MKTLWTHRPITHLLALLIPLAATFARAADYTDPAGFSFTYPDGWIVLDKAAQALIAKDLPAESQKLLQKGNVNADDKSNVVLVHKSHDTDYTEKLNISVQPGEPAINSNTIEKVIGAGTHQFASMNIPIENMTGRIQTYGSNRAVVLEYRATLPGLKFPVMQRQIMIPGGGKLFVVTCSTKPEAFSTYSPVFDSILTSMKVPAPTVRGFDWNSVIEKAELGAIAGGAAGALVWLVKKFSKPNQA